MLDALHTDQHPCSEHTTGDTYHDNPIASIDDASSQTATLVASEIQYATKLSVDHVLRWTGTGSISLLLHEPFGAKVAGSGLSSHVDSCKCLAKDMSSDQV